MQRTEAEIGALPGRIDARRRHVVAQGVDAADVVRVGLQGDPHADGVHEQIARCRLERLAHRGGVLDGEGQRAQQRHVLTGRDPQTEIGTAELHGRHLEHPRKGDVLHEDVVGVEGCDIEPCPHGHRHRITAELDDDVTEPTDPR